MAEIVEKSATIDDDTLRVRFSVRHARHEAGRWYHDRVEIIGSRPGRSIEKLFELDADRQVAADLKEPTTVDLTCPDIVIDDATITEIVISTTHRSPTDDTAHVPIPPRHNPSVSDHRLLPRRRWRWSRLVGVGALLGGLWMITPHVALAETETTVPPPPTTEPDCPAEIAAAAVRLDRLLLEGELALARQYADTLDAAYDCVEPLRRRVALQNDRAEALIDAAKVSADENDTTMAIEHYFDALDLDTTNVEARTALAGLFAPDDNSGVDPFARARELLAAGFEDDARTEVVKQLKENDDARADEIDDGLEKTLPKAESWTWSAPSTWFENVPETVRAVFRPPLVVLPILVLILYLFRLSTRGLTPRRRNEPIKKGPRTAGRPLATWGLTRNLVRPVVMFTVNAEGSGEVMVGPTLRDAVFAALVRDGGRLSLQAADAGDIAGALKEIEIGVDPLDTTAKLAAVILRRRTIDVALTLEPKRAGRVGASVIVTDWRGDVFDGTSFSQAIPQDDEDEDDLGEAYSSLSPEITAWLAFVLAEIWQPDRRPDDRVTFAGTSSYESYAAYLSGLRLHHRGDFERARNHYYKALDRDGLNTFAALNIGSIDARSPERLSNALTMFDIASPGVMPGHDDFRRWVRAEYLRAVTYLHRALNQWDPENPWTSGVSIAESADAKLAEHHADHLYRCLDAQTTGGCDFEHVHPHGHTSPVGHVHEHRHHFPKLSKQVDCDFAKRHLPTGRSLLLSIRLWRGLGTGAVPPAPASTDLAAWEEYMQWRLGEAHAHLWKPGLVDVPVSSYARYNLLCGIATASTYVDAANPGANDHSRGLVDLAFDALAEVLTSDPDITSQWVEVDPALAGLRVREHEDRWKKVVSTSVASTTADPTWTIVSHR